MYCYNCGKQIEDDSVFCPFCGTVLKEETKESKKETPAPKKEEVKETKTETPKEDKKFPLIPVICAAVGALVVIIVVVCVVLSSGKSINILDNVDLVFEGYNGYGKPSFVLEDEELTLSLFEDTLEDLQEEYHNVCELQNPEGEKCKKFEDKVYSFGVALESIEYSYATTNDKPIDELSNGDTVTIKIDYDKDAFKQAGYKLSNTSKKYKVEGLKEPEEIDIFSCVEPKWQSSNGEYYISLVPSGEFPIDSIPCDVSEPDSNGDVIVTINRKELARNYGYTVSDENATKTLHVGSAPRRIDSLTDDNRAQVEALAVYVLNNYYVNKCGSNLYGNGDAELMDYPTENNITSISVSRGTINASFNIFTDRGNKYRKSISFEGYIDSNGEYKCATEYNIETLGCSVSYGVWPEFD